MKGMGLLDGAGHRAAAQDDVAAVDDDGLAGGDGSLRLVKGQEHLPVCAARELEAPDNELLPERKWEPPEYLLR